jgi:cytochrome c-type biogenesis protein CcmH/NrfF
VLVFVAWVFLLAYMLGAASNANAADANSTAPAENQAAPVLERHNDQPQTTVQRVSSTVMCPTCDSTLDQSHSPAAERMRLWVKEAVRQGWTMDEIHTGLVKEYGGSEAILAVPRAQGIGLLAWLVPLFVVLAAASYGFLLVRRWRRNQRSRSLLNSEASPLDQAASSV